LALPDIARSQDLIDHGFSLVTSCLSVEHGIVDFWVKGNTSGIDSLEAFFVQDFKELRTSCDQSLGFSIINHTF